MLFKNQYYDVFNKHGQPISLTFTVATKSYYEEEILFRLKKRHNCSSETDSSRYIMWYKIRSAVQHDCFLESTNSMSCTRNSFIGTFKNAESLIVALWFLYKTFLNYNFFIQGNIVKCHSKKCGLQIMTLKSYCCACCVKLWSLLLF